MKKKTMGKTNKGSCLSLKNTKNIQLKTSLKKAYLRKAKGPFDIRFCLPQVNKNIRPKIVRVFKEKNNTLSKLLQTLTNDLKNP